MSEAIIELTEARIDTTVGDLICAIHEAIGESQIPEEETGALTKLVLDSLRLRYEI